MTSVKTFDKAPVASREAIKVDPDILDIILQPDEILAAAALDDAIMVAGENPESVNSEELELLRFQRSMIEMSDRNATFAAREFARRVGKYASHAHTFGQRPPSIEYPIIRGLVVPDIANEHRWRIIGINPSEYYGDNVLGKSYKSTVERSWREAIKAREDLNTARIAEASATERVLELPLPLVTQRSSTTE